MFNSSGGVTGRLARQDCENHTQNHRFKSVMFNVFNVSFQQDDKLKFVLHFLFKHNLIVVH